MGFCFNPKHDCILLVEDNQVGGNKMKSIKMAYSSSARTRLAKVDFPHKQTMYHISLNIFHTNNNYCTDSSMPHFFFWYKL